MAWRDSLRPASFRGVSFFVTSARTTQEAAADEHRFPGRTDPTKAVRIAAVGVGPRRYTVEAYVHGADYNERRDALEAALEEGQREPSRLVHPYRGERTVSVVGPITTLESADRGGYAKISFSCFDVSEAGLRSRVDPSDLTIRDLAAASDLLAVDYGEQMANVDGNRLDDARTAWDSGQSKMRVAASAVSSITSAIGEVTARVNTIETDFAALVQAPTAAVRSLTAAGKAIGELPDNLREIVTRDGKTLAEETYQVLRRAFFDDPLRSLKAFPPIDIKEKEVRATNATRFVVRAAGVFAAISALATGEISSRGAAIDYREALRDQLDDLMRVNDDGRLYEALRRLQTSLSGYLDAAAQKLPELRTVELAEDEPVLALAHRLFGDATKAGDIVDRNDLPRPHRIPAGSSLEVLR